MNKVYFPESLDSQEFNPKNNEQVSIAVLYALKNPEFAWKCPDEDYLQLIELEVNKLSSGIVFYGAFFTSEGIVVGYAFDIKPFIEMLQETTNCVNLTEKDDKVTIEISEKEVPVLMKSDNRFFITSLEKRF